MASLFKGKPLFDPHKSIIPEGGFFGGLTNKNFPFRPLKFGQKNESSLSNVPLNMSTPQGPVFAPPPLLPNMSVAPQPNMSTVQGPRFAPPPTVGISVPPQQTPPPAPVVPQIAGVTTSAPQAPGIQAPPPAPIQGSVDPVSEAIINLPNFNQNLSREERLAAASQLSPEQRNALFTQATGQQAPTTPGIPPIATTQPPVASGALSVPETEAQAPKTLIERLTELQEQRTAQLSPTERERELATQLSQVDIEGRRRQLAEEGRGAQIGAVRGEQGRIAEATRLERMALSSELQALQGIRKEEADALAEQMLFEEKIEGLKPQPPEPQTVKEGETIIKWDPTTGQFDTLFNAPRKPSSAFNEYLDAVGSGYSSSFMQYQMDLAEFKSSSGSGTGNPSRILSVTEATSLGVPYGTTEGEAYGTSTTQDQAEIYSDEKAERTISEVDALLEDAEANRGIFGRSAATPVPGFLRSNAFRNFEADLQTLAANIAFNELTAMRQASKTGGALGQVSERELALLQSTLGAFDMEQSPENVIKNLEKIKASVQRFRDATKQQGGGGSWTDPATGQTYDFSQGGGGTPTASGMRTDRHNNPTAFTTDVARQAGLREGIDYVAGDQFPNNPNAKTAKLLGNPVDSTIKVIDRVGFHTQGGQQRWTHTAMSPQKWAGLSYNQKKDIVKQMYQREGNKGALNKFFA